MPFQYSLDVHFFNYRFKIVFFTYYIQEDNALLPTCRNKQKQSLTVSLYSVVFWLRVGTAGSCGLSRVRLYNNQHFRKSFSL